MNPIANTGIFMGLTEGLGSAEKRRIAARATLISGPSRLLQALLPKDQWNRILQRSVPLR
jgi:small neutral amino acid transporter SnatA (MarC family)